MRTLSVIQPQELSDDFYFDQETRTWKVNFPEAGNGGAGTALPEGMQYVLSPSGKVEEGTVHHTTYTPRNLLAVSGTTEPFVAPAGRIVWDGVTGFTLPFPEPVDEGDEVPVDCALLLSHIAENQGFRFDMDAGVTCSIEFGLYHQDLLTTVTEEEELRYYYANNRIFKAENAEAAKSVTVAYEGGSIVLHYHDEQGNQQTDIMVDSSELSYNFTYLQELTNWTLRPTILLRVYSTNAGVDVRLDIQDPYQAEEQSIQVPAVVTIGELNKYKKEVEKTIANIKMATEKDYYSTAYGIGSRAGLYSVAIGDNTKCERFSTVVGAIALAGEYGTSIGYKTETNVFGVAVGHESKAGLYGSSYGYFAVTTGEASTALGMSAKATETHAIAIGASSSSKSAYGTAVGSNASVPEGCDYSTAIGYGAMATSANQARIGNIDVTLLASNVQSLSDERDKTNIADADLGLDFINKLRPVVYQFDYREKYFNMLYKLPNREDFEKSEDFDTAIAEYEHRRKDFYTNPVKDGSLAGKRPHYGLIAQEFKKIIDELGVDHAAYQHHEINGGCDVHSIGYADLVPNLIKAIQELSQENKTLMERLEKLESK